MKTSGGVDNNNICAIGLSRRQCVESHRSRVGTHLLLYYRHTDTLTPYTNLLYSGSTEGVGSTEINLLASLLELIGKLADSRGLANAIDSDNQYDIRLVLCRQIPVVVVASMVLGKERGNLVAHDAVKLGCRHILVASHTLFDALDNLKSSLHTYIRCNQSLLKIVEHLVVDSRLAHYCTLYLVEYAMLCLFESVVEDFLSVLIKKSKNSHITLYFLQS